MITVYFDESGTHDSSPAVAVAGYLASSEAWGKFQSNWRDVLHKYGISFFHMTDFEARQKQFKDWPRDQRIELQSDLIKIIKQCTQVAFSAATVREDYEYVKHNYNRSIYLYTLYQAIGGVADWADAFHYPGKIDYVFDQGAAKNGELDILRQQIESNPNLQQRFRIGSWTVANMRDRNPLQAADIIAFETFKEMCNYIVPNKEKIPKRKSMEKLLQGANIYQGYFYKGNFRALQSHEIW